MRCLAKEPDDRYQSAQAVLTDLQRIRDGQKIQRNETSTPVEWFDERVAAAAAKVFFSVLLLLTIGAIYIGNSVRPTSPVPGLAIPIPPAGLAHIGSGPKLNGEKYHDSDELDTWSYKYFMDGDYERAIPLLEFGIKTCQEGGKHYGNSGGEDTYLADNYQHLGKCHLALNNPQKAVPNYQEALRLYNKYGKYPGGSMAEAVADYSTTLERLGKMSEAAKMKGEFEKNGRLSVIP